MTECYCGKDDYHFHIVRLDSFFPWYQITFYDGIKFMPRVYYRFGFDSAMRKAKQVLLKPKTKREETNYREK